MMKRSKSLVALLLVLCMAMTFVVPMAFAETETLYYEFGADINGNVSSYPEGGELSYWNDSTTVKNGTVTVETDTAKGLSRSSYLGKNQGRYAQIYYNGTTDGARQTAFRFNGTGAWGAVKIYGVKAGTYDMTFKAVVPTSQVILYILTIAEYNEFISAFASDRVQYTASTTSSGLASGSDIANNGSYSGVYTFAVNGNAQHSYTVEDVEFDADGEYVLLFRNTSGSNAMILRRMQMTREIPAAPADPVAYIGETPYTSLGAALEAAQSGDEIDLADNVADAGSFTVPSGVTLDLNGKNLSAGEINVGGKLIDSVSGGVVTGTIVCANGNDGWLPLTNGNGKSLYKVNAASLGFTNKTDDSAKFGFNVHFEKEAAYALAGDVTIKVALTWDGGNVDAIASGTFVSDWASTNSGNGKAIGVTVNGLTGVANFKLQPVVEVNGVTINLAPIAL